MPPTQEIMAALEKYIFYSIFRHVFFIFNVFLTYQRRKKKLPTYPIEKL